MDSFIAYHSINVMGEDYPLGPRVGFYSRKSEKLLRSAIGSVAWVIIGEPGPKHTTFYLAGNYTPETLTDEGEQWLIEGPGRRLSPRLDVTSLPWFRELKREQSNFSLGFNRIANPSVIAELRRLSPPPSASGAAAAGSPAPSVRPWRAGAAASSEGPPMGNGGLLDTCIYTIVTRDLLDRVALERGPMTREEGRTWTTAARLLETADAEQRRLPILLADAKDCSRLLYWGVVSDLAISETDRRTRYTVDRLRPFRGAYAPQDLVLERSGEHIAPNFIRPYAICKTPDFISLHDEAFLSPEEGPAPEMFTEGTATRVTVNAYERNQEARRKCIAAHGVSCAVCGMSFEATYGSIGRDFIHVHHLVPLSDIGEAYAVDPIRDLRPVCPNCHAMLHRGSPPLSIEDLRRRLQHA